MFKAKEKYRLYSQYAQFSKCCEVATSDDRQVVALQISADNNKYLLLRCIQHSNGARSVSHRVSAVNTNGGVSLVLCFITTGNDDVDISQMLLRQRKSSKIKIAYIRTSLSYCQRTSWTCALTYTVSVRRSIGTIDILAEGRQGIAQPLTLAILSLP